MRALLLGLALLFLAAPAWADSGACAPILHHDVRPMGRQIMVSVLVELQSPGSINVCVDLPDDVLASRAILRVKLPNGLVGQYGGDPVLDSCVSFRDHGAHPGDGWAKAWIDDRAGSYQCVVGPDADGVWYSQPARVQVYQVTYYVSLPEEP